MVGAIAGVVGGLASAAIGAYGAAQERKAANRRREQANQQISAWQQQAERILAESEAGRTRLSDADALNRYKAIRDSYDPSAFTFEPQKFDKSVYNVEDYLNPNRDAILADVAKTTQHTAAGAGLGHSSGALEAITKNVIDKDEDLLREARAEMKDERSFDYGMYTDYINPNREAILADVAKTTQHTAAGAGLGHSSGALEAITKNVIDKDEDLLREARAEMKDERSFDYGMYTDYINQQQKKLDSMQQGYRTQLETLRGDIAFDQQQTDATLQNRLSLGNAIAQSRAQLV